MAVLVCVLAFAPHARANSLHADAPPAVSNVRILTPHVVVYDRFEIQFDVTTAATDLYMPFEAAPPKGVIPAIGVTVDALFSSDAWKTTLTQPAFWYQPYDYTFINNQDHFVPNAAPRWTVRFAPQMAGTWQFRVRVTDVNGTTESDAETFFVDAGGDRYRGLRETPYTRNGFVRVSKKDTRYFEFEDGAPFQGQGYNVAFVTLPSVQNNLRAWQENGINFVRVWLSGAGINGAAWTSWSAPGQPANKLPLVSDVTAPGSQFSLNINNERRCVYTDFNQEDVPVLPETKYHVWARVKLKDVSPWEGNSGGLAIRAAGFTPNCTSVKGIDSTAPVLNGTTDWVTVEGDLTTRANQYGLPYLWLILDKAQGEIWIDEVRLYRADDPAQVNLLREPRADSVYEFDPMNSFKWDQFIEAAEQSGTFLKLVTDEKDEWIRNHLAADGGVTNTPGNVKFYGAPNTQVRWFDEAWWRYLIARWGYSTAIHSFEFVNEGDPFQPPHYEAADAMAKYFHEHDPSHHLVTTSFWHSYPGAEFWANPKYPNVDYADLHAYILTGWGDNASFVPIENLEARPEYVRSAPTSLHLDLLKDFEQELTPRGLSLQEPGEWTVRYWIKGKNAAADCGDKTNARVWWILDDGLEYGKPQDNPIGVRSDAECSAPAGTFDWTPVTVPIAVFPDQPPREFHLFASNSLGTGGNVWIDDLELVTPSGKVVPIIGSFDSNSFTSDTAWYTAAYSSLWSANSPVAAKMPVIRAEGGINSKNAPNGRMDVNKDQEGVWLHNLLWGQINPGGMYELLWWGSEMLQDNPKTGRNGDLFWQYKTYQEFMWDVPINNGNYRDAAAKTNNPNLRAWGQRDDVNGRAHLWVQNRLHTWDRVVNGESVPALSGIIALRDMKAGTWRVEWWDPWKAGVVMATTTVKTVDGMLTLALPQPLASDVAVKLMWIGDTTQ